MFIIYALLQSNQALVDHRACFASTYYYPAIQDPMATHTK